MSNLQQYLMSQKESFKHLVGCEIKSTKTIFKTEMFIYQSKANLDEKILFVKSHIFQSQQLGNACKGSVCESEIPRSVLVHDMLPPGCGIEVHSASFRNRILISRATKLWTRME